MERRGKYLLFPAFFLLFPLHHSFNLSCRSTPVTGDGAFSLINLSFAATSCAGFHEERIAHFSSGGARQSVYTSTILLHNNSLND